MDMSIVGSVSAIAIFLQGLLSFLSPCILPLVPLYLTYLSTGARTIDENGIAKYKRVKLLINTIFFIIGISFAFFLLGFGFSQIGRFFSQNQVVFARISGVLIIALGLIQLGLFDFKWTNKTMRLPFNINKVAMNPFIALVLGFTFSFAWTPCVGPMLTSVLLLASSAKTATIGYALIGIYTLGFTLPFLLLGIFVTTVLNFFKKHKSFMKVTTKIGGVIMILLGVMTLTGWMNNITGYFSTFEPIEVKSEIVVEEPFIEEEQVPLEEAVSQEETSFEEEIVESVEEEVVEEREAKATGIFAPEFSLNDQFGNTHSMSDYLGKVVFLNFWATWCPPCKAEMPDIQAIYEEYGYNEKDVAIIGIAAPNFGREGSIEEISSFLETNGYTYPVLFDTDGSLNYFYGISSLPTTFMIMENGEIFGYVPGSIPKTLMQNIIEQTKEAYY